MKVKTVMDFEWFLGSFVILLTLLQEFFRKLRTVQHEISFKKAGKILSEANMHLHYDPMKPAQLDC